SWVAVRKTGGVGERKMSRRLLVWEKQPNAPPNIFRKNKRKFTRCATGLKKRFSKTYPAHRLTALVPPDCQTHRVSHSKKSNRLRHCCCWIDTTFVARPARHAGRGHRKHRTCCAQWIRAATARGAACASRLAGITRSRRSTARLRLCRKSSRSCANCRRPLAKAPFQL